MKRLFTDSFGVDHKVTRPKSQVVCLDLQRPEHQELAFQWASDPKCVWIHFGIPCGTSSRARDRRMSKTSHGPPPLRSASFPNGLPPHMLSPNMLARVRAANRLYLFMQKLIESLSPEQIWTIENPWRSWNKLRWQSATSARDLSHQVEASCNILCQVSVNVTFVLYDALQKGKPLGPQDCSHFRPHFA